MPAPKGDVMRIHEHVFERQLPGTDANEASSPAYANRASANRNAAVITPTMYIANITLRKWRGHSCSRNSFSSDTASVEPSALPAR